MFGYFLQLALQNFRRNIPITALTILVIAFGVGASMTAYSIFRAMSGDPLPWKSDRMFVPRIDTLGPTVRRGGPMPDLLPYRDALELRGAPIATRKTPIYEFAAHVIPDAPGFSASHVVGLAVGAIQ